MVPLPEPLELVVIQLALLKAVQVQPAGAEILNELLPPGAKALWLAGLIEYEQLVALNKLIE